MGFVDTLKSLVRGGMSPQPAGPISVEQERALRAHGYTVRRPRYTKQDVRSAACRAFPDIPDVFYTEHVDGLEVVGVLTGTGLRDAKVRCKFGEQSRMRSGFVSFLAMDSARLRS